MFFNRRQEPKEFVSAMPEYDEDQDEYYGEEDGDVDEGDEYDDEGDEDEEESASSSAGSKNWVKTALMGIAAFALLGGGAYYALLMVAPEVVDEVVNSVTATDPIAEAPPPVDTAAAVPPPGEAAPPPPGDGQAGNPAPGGDAAVAPPPPGAPAVPAEKPKPKFPIPTPASELEDIEPIQEPVTRPAGPKAKPKPVAAKPPGATSKWRAQRAAQQRAYRQRVAAQRRKGGYSSRPRPTAAKGTPWIQGQSAYIPWGGGKSRAWQRAPQGRTKGYAPARQRGRYGVQVGAFANAGNAAALVTQLRSQGISAYTGRGRGGLSRVYVGSYRNLRTAGAVMRKLQNQGIPAAVTVH